MSPGLPYVWGATGEEIAAEYGCDGVLTDAAGGWFRAVTVRAPAPRVFRWLCQLRVAPYSYDLVDNFGRRSPRTLTPGLDVLETGQRVMTIFELVSFRRGSELTLRLRTPSAVRLFGELAISYAVRPAGPEKSRLVVKLVPGRADGAVTAARLHALAWGDLIMMRKQLHTLRDLAEAGQSVTAGGGRRVCPPA